MASCGLLLEGACDNKKQRERENKEEQLRSRMLIEVVAGSGGVQQELEVFIGRATVHPLPHACACSSAGCISRPDVACDTLDPWFCARLNSLPLKRLNQSTHRWNQL